jgi:hypothetical protein
MTHCTHCIRLQTSSLCPKSCANKRTNWIPSCRATFIDVCGRQFFSFVVVVFTRVPFCVSEDDQGSVSPMTPRRRKTWWDSCFLIDVRLQQLWKKKAETILKGDQDLQSVHICKGGNLVPLSLWQTSLQSFLRRKMSCSEQHLCEKHHSRHSSEQELCNEALRMLSCLHICLRILQFVILLCTRLCYTFKHDDLNTSKPLATGKTWGFQICFL